MGPGPCGPGPTHEPGATPDSGGPQRPVTPNAAPALHRGLTPRPQTEVGCSFFAFSSASISAITSIGGGAFTRKIQVR